jgi:hypothetical protein
MDVMENKVVFAHRIKWDGKQQQASLCPDCFQPISSASGDAGVEANAAPHRCPEMELKEALDYFRLQPVQIGRKLPRIV